MKPTRKIIFLAAALNITPAMAAEVCTKIDSGKASVYAWKFDGRKTSSGEIFDQDDMTVAHKSLPFGTRLKLVDKKTRKVAYAEVNDRGPFNSRKVDMTVALWAALGHTPGKRGSNRTLGVTSVDIFKCVARSEASITHDTMPSALPEVLAIASIPGAQYNFSDHYADVYGAYAVKMP